MKTIVHVENSGEDLFENTVGEVDTVDGDLYVLDMSEQVVQHYPAGSWVRVEVVA